VTENGRKTNGQFGKGNQFGRGNGGRPPKKREERYTQILMTSCTFSDWKDIVQRAVDQAKGGDKDARKWLSDYLVGSPVQKHAVASVDWENLVIDWGDSGDNNADDNAA